MAHGSLSVRISTRFDVSQPAPFSRGGETVVVAEQEIDVVEGDAQLIELEEGSTLQDVVRALNLLGVTHRATSLPSCRRSRPQGRCTPSSSSSNPMTIPVSPLLDTGLPTALSGEGASSPERLQEVVREFEALFIHQMLRSMRESSEWLGDDEDELFGARLIETIDVELARQLAESGGLGLAALLTPSLFGPEGNPLTGFAPGAATAAAQSPLDAEPLLSDRVTSEFGFRNDPLAGDHRFHAGVDLRAAYGREIGAAGSGQVVFAGEQGGYGLTVVIEHGLGRANAVCPPLIDRSRRGRLRRRARTDRQGRRLGTRDRESLALRDSP